MQYNMSAIRINDFFISVREQYRALHSINRKIITFNEVQCNSRRVSDSSLFHSERRYRQNISIQIRIMYQMTSIVKILAKIVKY